MHWLESKKDKCKVTGPSIDVWTKYGPNMTVNLLVQVLTMYKLFIVTLGQRRQLNGRIDHVIMDGIHKAIKNTLTRLDVTSWL